MRYLLLIYEDESRYDELSEAEQIAILDQYRALDDALRDSGNFLAGEPLQPTPLATSVRLRDGRTVVTDGPFAETKEQLGGFYMVEARDVDEAIAIAARVPSARSGTIEVRPILELETRKQMPPGGENMR